MSYLVTGNIQINNDVLAVFSQFVYHIIQFTLTEPCNLFSTEWYVSLKHPLHYDNIKASFSFDVQQFISCTCKSHLWHKQTSYSMRNPDIIQHHTLKQFNYISEISKTRTLSIPYLPMYKTKFIGCYEELHLSFSLLKSHVKIVQELPVG
jgi:hypothetical protein